MASLFHPPGLVRHLCGAGLVQGLAVLERDLRVVGAVYDQYRRLHGLDLRLVLEDVEPVHVLHIVDHPKPALQRAVQDDAAQAVLRSEVQRRHATYGLSVADDLLLRDAAIVREVAVSRLDITVEVCLAWITGALAIAAVFVRKDVDLELGAQLLEVVKHDANVGAVAVAKEQSPRRVCAVEVKAEDDIATASPHPHGVNHDAFR
mmetsp:Transcript_45463/g.117601  ORF Transcript_45463/g.117601 Transcript_45463/m.117601 type:complete len:205 (+) Transcript_45463:227-841(+)